MNNQDLSNFSMLDLFRMELETQTATLSDNLLILETKSDAPEALTCLMRAAHSIKGAAMIVQIEPVVKIAHAMEDCFVAAQQGSITLSSNQIDILLQAVDWLLGIAQIAETELQNWLSAHADEIETTAASISTISNSSAATITALKTANSEQVAVQNIKISEVEQNSLKTTNSEQLILPNLAISEVEEQASISMPQVDRAMRISTENLNRLMSLAGESLVQANWLQPFSDSLQKLRQQQNQLLKNLEKFQDLLSDTPQNQLFESQLVITRNKASECYQFLVERLNELENFSRSSTNLSDRLYREVIATQMRPFADRVESFPRIVRDLARQLEKQVKLEILGKSTPVDRDILEKLEAPLIHLLRNAIAHGIELPEERLALGKSAEGIVRLEAVHQAGILSITVSDDGRGVDFEQLRQKIINKGIVNSEIAAQLTETELIEFLFLPGFSTAQSVTEVSGRGVGLDIVQSMVQQVGGKLRATSHPGRGIKFSLQLPLTLSVIRSLLVEISGEVYALPITRLEQLVMIDKSEIFAVENRHAFRIEEAKYWIDLS